MGNEFGYIPESPEQSFGNNKGIFTPTDIYELARADKWTDLGQLELIETQTFSAVSTVDFTAIKEITYNVHFVTVNNIQISDTGSHEIRIRFYEQGTLETGNSYEQAYIRGDSNSAFGSITSTGTGFLLQARNFGASDTNASAGGYSYFYNLGDNRKRSFQSMHSSYLDNSSNGEFTYGSGLLEQSSQVDGIQFYSSSGTISGTITLYGVKEYS